MGISHRSSCDETISREVVKGSDSMSFADKNLENSNGGLPRMVRRIAKQVIHEEVGKRGL